MGDGNWKPLAILLIVTFAVGTLLSLILVGFVDTTITNPASSSFSHFLVDYTNGTGIYVVDMSIFGIPFSLPTPNIFGLLPDIFQQYFVTQFVALSYVPNIILIPFSILWIFALIWTLSALLKPSS